QRGRAAGADRHRARPGRLWQRPLGLGGRRRPLSAGPGPLPRPARPVRLPLGGDTMTTTPAPRRRIVGHRKVRARDLVPHQLNPRRHSSAQRQTLLALYQEIGFARSLLAYELPDGRLKLIDGHLRQTIDPDMEVDVEVLDVTDAEARQLLLSLDPLAQL